MKKETEFVMLGIEELMFHPWSWVMKMMMEKMPNFDKTVDLGRNYI